MAKPKYSRKGRLGTGTDRVVDAVAGEHGFDGLGVALGHPAARGVFVHDEEVAVAVLAAEEGDGVVGEAVVQGGEPLDGAVSSKSSMTWTSRRKVVKNWPAAMSQSPSRQARFCQPVRLSRMSRYSGLMKALSSTRAGMKRVAVSLRAAGRGR